MKTILLGLILVLSQAGLVFSQDETTTRQANSDNGEIKTIFKKSDHHIKIGYYLGPEAAWTQFDGKNVFLGGLSMGMIFDHFFSVGLAGYGILNSNKLWYDLDGSLDAARGAYLYGGYGGIKFEFRVLPASPVHLNFPILIGGGGLVNTTWTCHDQSGGLVYNTWTNHDQNYHDNN